MKKRSRAARLVPALMVAAATAIPAATAVDLLTHASPATNLVALSPSTPGGLSPAGSTGSSATATSTGATTAGSSGAGGPSTTPATASATGTTSTAASSGAGVTAASSSSAGTATPAATAATGSVSKTYVGTAEQNRYGTVQVTLVVTGNKITDVIVTAPQDNPRSASINSYAVPVLRSETLQAQSANIDAVSGATYTSESYIGSLQAALAEANL